MAQRLTIDGRIPLASNPFAGFGPRQNDLPLILEATFDQLHLAHVCLGGAYCLGRAEVLQFRQVIFGQIGVMDAARELFFHFVLKRILNDTFSQYLGPAYCLGCSSAR
jgi:hypothetical protein